MVIRFIKRRWILILCSFFLLYCFAYNVIYADPKIPFPLGDGLGSFFSNIGFSVIASSIFYLIALSVDWKNKKTYYKYVLAKAEGMIRIKDSIIGAMEKETSLSVNEKDGLKEILSRIDPYGNAPMRDPKTNQPFNWVQYIDIYLERSNRLHVEITPYLAAVDVELMEGISNLTGTFFVAHLSNACLKLMQLTPCNKVFTNFYEVFERYIEVCNDLQKVIDTLKKEYRLT